MRFVTVTKDTPEHKKMLEERPRAKYVYVESNIGYSVTNFDDVVFVAKPGHYIEVGFSNIGFNFKGKSYSNLDSSVHIEGKITGELNEKNTYFMGGALVITDNFLPVERVVIEKAGENYYLECKFSDGHLSKFALSSSSVVYSSIPNIPVGDIIALYNKTHLDSPLPQVFTLIEFTGQIRAESTYTFYINKKAEIGFPNEVVIGQEGSTYYINFHLQDGKIAQYSFLPSKSLQATKKDFYGPFKEAIDLYNASNPGSSIKQEECVIADIDIMRKLHKLMVANNQISGEFYWPNEEDLANKLILKLTPDGQIILPQIDTTHLEPLQFALAEAGSAVSQEDGERILLADESPVKNAN